MRNKSLSIITFLLFIMFSMSGWTADTHIAKDPSYAEVSAAVAAASSGDTVLVLAGTATWDSTLTINKSITLQGAGIDSTTITGTGTITTLAIEIETDVPLRIVGMRFRFSNNNNSGKSIHIRYGNYHLTKIRIDHCKFEKSNAGIFVSGRVEGLIDHNVFLNNGNGIGVNGDNLPSWQRPFLAGTPSSLFVENNTFLVDDSSERSDVYYQVQNQYGARVVYRYNTFDSHAYTKSPSYFIDWHGNQGGYFSGDNSKMRSSVLGEIYNNTFSGYYTYANYMFFRGGSILLYDNVFLRASSNGSLRLIELGEQEAWDTYSFPVLRTQWPAQDQINNSFFWNNNINGDPITDIVLGNSLDATFIQINRDYFMHEPRAAGGNEVYTGSRQGGSQTSPTESDTGSMIFVSSGPNAYYPYIPYVFPHPLSAQGESGRLLDLQAAPSGSSLALSWQLINGATTYRIVRDWQEAQAMIVAGTSWIDTAPAGEHVYMVYALDNTGKILAAEGKLRMNQVLNFVTGWNWISFNVLPADFSLNSIFSDILAQVEQVKAQTQSAMRSSGIWKGDLADMNGIGQYKMYKVKVSAACTLTVSGTAALSASPIQLGGGWNWVAYLPTPAMPIATALASINGRVQEVKSLTQSATYNGNSWSGTLTQLNPGQGYAIKMNAPGTLTYPAGQ